MEDLELEVITRGQEGLCAKIIVEPAILEEIKIKKMEDLKLKKIFDSQVVQPNLEWLMASLNFGIGFVYLMFPTSNSK